MKYPSIILIAIVSLLFGQPLMAQSNDTVSFFFSKKQIEEKIKQLDTIPKNIPKYDKVMVDGRIFLFPIYDEIYVSKQREGIRNITCIDYKTDFVESIIYICPICKEETFYKTNASLDYWLHPFGKQIIVENNKIINIEAWSDTHWILREKLNIYKDEVQKIKEIHLALDESEFCKYCSPFVKKPQLYLLTNIEGETDTNKIIMNLRYLHSIELLRDFLNGTLVCTSKKHLDFCRERIKELLGLKEN